jgi:hypothetical protein
MTPRAVELSLFPDVRPERPTGPLLGSVVAGTNAGLIAAIAPLYLHGNTVMDVTYGRGKWWDRYRPEGLICHDLTLDGVDFRHLPEDDDSVDVVCFDPPYVPCGSLPHEGGNGKQAHARDFRERFGLQPMARSQIIALFDDGLREAARVASRWVLAKCGDYVTGGRFHLGHLDMVQAARSAGLGDPWDLIVHHSGSGPGGYNIVTPLRARRAHSYLLVFEVPQ